MHADSIAAPSDTPSDTRSDAPSDARQFSGAFRRNVVAALFAGRHHGRTRLTVAPADVATGPAVLAQAHPECERDAARTLYERCLAHYRTSMRPQDRDTDDVGAAVARFVAVNFRALIGIATTSALLARLESQMIPLVRGSRVWHATDEAGRQLFFERIAVLTVLVDATERAARQQGEAAVEHVRNAARDYLREFLGIDPTLVTIGADGLAGA